jgi:hypothetical protein
MNCAELARHLDELLENRLAPALRAAAEEHVRTCAACRPEVAGLRRVLAEAASLPESVEPLEDLWPSIEARLAPRPALRAKRFDWRTLAVAATLAAALVTAGILLRPRGPGGERVATGEPSATAPIPASLPFDAAEQALLETKQRLREALAERRSTLSPATAAAVDRNLEVIENAIEEIRVALERDPANPHLNRRLLAIHQQELAFLQHVTQHGRPLQAGEEGPG